MKKEPTAVTKIGLGDYKSMARTNVIRHFRRTKKGKVEVRKHEREYHSKPFTKMPKSTFHLPVENAVLVPSTDKNQKSISSQELDQRTKETQRFLSEKFGGHTSIRADGGYIMKSDGSLVRERVNKVTAFATNSDYQKGKKALQKFIERKKKKWGQESIGLEHEGDLYYL